MDDKTTQSTGENEPAAAPINNVTPDMRDAIRSIDATGEDGSNPGIEDNGVQNDSE